MSTDDNVTPLPDTWRVAFQSSTMRVSFALALTKPMMEMLCAVSDEVHWDRSLYAREFGVAAPNNWLASEGALIKRGLIVRITGAQIDKDDPQRVTWLQLTPAGEALVNLLRVAGLFVQADASLLRKSKAAHRGATP